jgi:hypothetical protein
MARDKDRIKAVTLRKSGMSYSQIKVKLGISKSTLSGWLYKYPLSPERLKELRDNSQIRIEKYRETMRKKRQKKVEDAYCRVSKDISKLNKRDIFLGGLFLYWGEGSKTLNSATMGVSNTDPAVIKFFLAWLSIFEIDKSKVSLTLQLYSDMDEDREINFWSKELSVKKNQFRKCYMKKSSTKDISYKREFIHGTCNARIYSQNLNHYVLMGVKRLQEISEEVLKESV